MPPYPARALLPLCLLLPAVVDSAGDPAPRAARSVELRLTQRSGGYRDVLIKRGAAWVNLTRHHAPTHIYQHRVSPDGRFLLVWHMSSPPRRVSIYRLPDGKRVEHFTPGYGGRLDWTPAGTLLHWWGAGTRVTVWRLYDRRGKTLLRGVAPGIEPSPDRRYLLEDPDREHDLALVIWDLVSRTRVYLCPPSELGDPRTLPTASWLDPRHVQLGVVERGRARSRLIALPGRAGRGPF